MAMTGTTGEIITFYSYKGGTGRSMAVCNVACLLAERQSKGRGVLMIDWDLEAPGLDRYFHNKFKIPAQEFKEKKGLIDLFLKLDALTPKSYLFCWDEIPGKDNERLIEFLIQNFGIDWANRAKIEKVNDETIKVSNESKSLSMKLIDKKTKVNIKINASRTEKLFAKTENGTLNIYDKKKDKKGIEQTKFVGEDAEKIAYDALDSVDLNEFIVETDIDYLSLLKAGCFDANYSNKVNSFDWESLHNRSPLLIRLFAERLAEKYRYILIDSRTGYTDISGICTMLMPEKLVVVFSPNRQSYTGIKELVKMAMKYRRMSDDLRPLLVFPLPSRIEFSMDELRRDWRFGRTDKDIEGFQPMFENLFKEVYELEECPLKDYFDEVQIQQNPYYAYGEEIAVIANEMEKRFTDRFTLAKSFSIFTEWLVNSTAPWQLIKMEKKINVFLSYVEADRLKAQAIAEALENQGFSVWWDRSNIPGKNFAEIIEEKINAAKCVIVLWSKHSVESMWVKAEATEGEKRGILVPILIEDVEPPRAFRMIKSAKLIDLDGKSDHSEFNLLFESVTRNIGLPPDKKIFINPFGMKFVLIPAGEFMMGSEDNDNEKPVHNVTISKSFYISIYQVTQHEWKKIMRNNPSNFKGDNLPVEQVSWKDVQEFIIKLNETEGANKYRLPSEAEWEYAARAGTTTRYSFGDDESELDKYAWYDLNARGKTHEVGQKNPNPWGLYDMHGNVWEWVQDKWHDNYNDSPNDGSSWETGNHPHRVVRGGGWSGFAGGWRSAYRYHVIPEHRAGVVGFRLLRTL